MISPSIISIEHSRYGIRETTEGCKKIIPELRLVGHVNYNRARPSFFNRHQHPDVLEIFYIVRGKVSWWVEGISSEVCGNELFLVWPRELHGAKDNIVEPSEYYWIQVHLPFLRRGIGGGKTLQLEKDLRSMPERRIAATTALLPLYQSLLKEHAQREVYRKSIVRETLHLLLSLVLRCSRMQASSLSRPCPHHPRLALSLRWAKENLTEATMKGMVKISGLDAAIFRKYFFVLTGSSPAQYLIRLRLQNAKEQLTLGCTITEISHQLGFSSSQYFATVFRKYEGLSPSDFIAKLKLTSRF
jgi:AraC-like DNA-binding protein/mannose-6-phosphate isomerase-like protein (cupin superfamily)